MLLSIFQIIIKMSIKKQILKSKNICKVSFSIPAVTLEAQEKVAVLGDFNNWNVSEALLLKKGKDGVFKGNLELATGKEYEFRYLVDEKTWANEVEADKFAPNVFGAENSVIIA